jgi:hypothetical protein
VVGAKGFEPSTSWSRTRRASQAALRPDSHAPPQLKPKRSQQLTTAPAPHLHHECRAFRFPTPTVPINANANAETSLHFSPSPSARLPRLESIRLESSAQELVTLDWNDQKSLCHLGAIQRGWPHGLHVKNRPRKTNRREFFAPGGHTQPTRLLELEAQCELHRARIRQ